MLHALTLSIIISLCATHLAFAQDIEHEKMEALTMLDRGQPNKAVEKLERLTTANPSDAALLYYLGYAQIKTGQIQKASASFEKGIQLNDKETLNYVGQGYLKLVEQKDAEAKVLFDKALGATKSKNTAVINAIADAYVSNKKNLNEAQQLLLKSKGLNGNDPYTLILLGDTYFQLNDGGKAISQYENAAALNNKIALPHYKIGLLYTRSKNLDAAFQAFNKAVTIDPNFANAYKELAELYYSKKEADNAVKAQESYMALADDREAGKRQYAFYLFMAKNYSKANEIFSDVIKEQNVLPITYRFYGVSLIEAGDFEKSKSMFEKYFEVAKTEVQANDYAYYGKALLKLKEDSLAIQSFQKSLALDSTQAEILQLKAEVLYKRKKYEQAVSDYQKLIALRKKPLSQDFYGIGRSYYYNNQLAEADSAFNKLIGLQPTMTVGYLWQARVKANEDPESTQGLAKPCFEKLIEIASSNPDKNKNDLIEAYSYLGYYHYLKKENVLSKSYWEKVLKLNPNDERAKEALKVIH